MAKFKEIIDPKGKGKEEFEKYKESIVAHFKGEKYFIVVSQDEEYGYKGLVSRSGFLLRKPGDSISAVVMEAKFGSDTSDIEKIVFYTTFVKPFQKKKGGLWYFNYERDKDGNVVCLTPKNPSKLKADGISTLVTQRMPASKIPKEE